MAITITENTYQSVKKIDFAWTALTTGTTGGTTVNSYDGEVLGVVASNVLIGAGTIAINDEDDYDILMGGGTLTTGTTYYWAGSTGVARIGAVSNSPLTLELTVNTTGGSGNVLVYIR